MRALKNRLLLLALASFPCTACLSTAPPLLVRYFEPDVRAVEASSPRGAPRLLRLANVSARASLRDRMVWRPSAFETTFDERNRWTAAPPELVEEVLKEALFVRGPFVPAEVRPAPSLWIHLTAFEGVLGEAPYARVALVATLFSRDESPSASQSFESSAPLVAETPEALARGMTDALEALLPQLIDWLERR